MKLPANEDTQTRGEAPFYVDEKAVNDYYPFGMLIADDGSDNRSWQAGNYRYGYNGMELDNEVKGTGNQIDYGARIYDPRTARFYSLDPLSQKFSHQSNYLYAANSPIFSIDKKGQYAYAFHYIMTYNAMIELGYSKDLAHKMAYYASVYADHPNPNKNSWTFFDHLIDGYNRFIMILFGFNPSNLDYRSEQDKKENTTSQADDTPDVTLHSMRAYFEGIDEKEATRRALYGGTFETKEKKTIVIKGALQIIKEIAKTGKKIDDLTEKEQKILFKAFHTVQDAAIHKGQIWVDGHKRDAEMAGKKNQHPDLECSAPIGGTFGDTGLAETNTSIGLNLYEKYRQAATESQNNDTKHPANK